MVHIYNSHFNMINLIGVNVLVLVLALALALAMLNMASMFDRFDSLGMLDRNELLIRALQQSLAPSLPSTTVSSFSHDKVETCPANSAVATRCSVPYPHKLQEGVYILHLTLVCPVCNPVR